MDIKGKFSEQEWLSDYLSNRLSATDKAAFEARLSTDKDLRASYESLLATMVLLQRAPRRKAPHNFTISREAAAKIRRQTTTLPILRLSSALSAVVSVVLFAFAFLVSRPVLNPAMMMAPAPMAEKSADSQSVEAPQIITWGSPYNGMGGGDGGGEAYGKGGGAPEAVTTDSLPMEAEAAPPAAAAEEALPPTTEESFSMAAPEAQAEVMPEPTQSIEMPAPESATNRDLESTQAPEISDLPEITGSGPILGVNPSTSDVNEDSAARSVPQQSMKQNSILIIIGSVLLLLAATSGIAAILVSKRKL